jgi:hypothetical protein
MDNRLGQVLVERGVLDQAQVEAVLERQRVTGEPFGLICERQFHVHPEEVERAWADQYSRIAPLVDLMTEPAEPRALDLVTRRQAWQFRVLPLRFEGRELVIATTAMHLRRAMRFALVIIGMPVNLVLTTPAGLGEALSKYYPFPGLTPQSIEDDAAERTAPL